MSTLMVGSWNSPEKSTETPSSSSFKPLMMLPVPENKSSTRIVYLTLRFKMWLKCNTQMREVLYSKLVFVDSHDGLKGSKTLRPSFHVPTNAFSCGQGEAMRMVLTSKSEPMMEIKPHSELKCDAASPM